MFNPIHSQEPFDCLTNGINPSLTTTARGTSCGGSFGADLTDEEIALLPEVIVNVNVHFIGSAAGNFVPILEGQPGYWNRANGIRFVRNSLSGLVVNANQRLQNLTANTAINPGGTNRFRDRVPQLPSFTVDPRISINLYTEGGSDDPFEGIWFWDDRATFDAATLKYKDQVLNILISDKGNGCKRQGNWIPGNCDNGGSKSQMVINLFNAFANADAQDNGTATANFCSSQDWGYASLFLHELGHACGMTHAWNINNLCSVYEKCEDRPACSSVINSTAGSKGCDIDPVLECNNGNCATTNASGPGHGCKNWLSGSNNIMGGNGNMNGLSPCQWGIMYNFLSDVCYAELGESPCVENSTPLEITDPDEVWESERIMNRPVIIKTGAQLTVQCKVFNSPEAYFEVERGAKLIIDGGILSNLCPTNLWRGVTVIGSPDKFHTASVSDFGVVEMRNGGCIEFASTGIKAKDGGIVQAQDAFFRNNKWGVKFYPYEHKNISFFESTEFYSDDESGNITDAGTPVGSFGVTMWAVDGVYFSASKFHDLVDVGIYSAVADFGVYNGCEFTDIGGIGIQTTNRSLSRKAGGYVQIIGNEPLYSGPVVSLSPNIFRNCSTGVDASSPTVIRIFGNDISECTVGVNIFGEVYDFGINRNTFNCIEESVICSSTGSIPGLKEIGCNTHSNVDFGISIIGNNKSTIIYNETFGSNDTDIRLIQNSGDPSAIYEEQGSDDTPAGNEFTLGKKHIISSTQSGTEFFKYYHLTTDPTHIPDCDKTVTSCANNFENKDSDGSVLNCSYNDTRRVRVSNPGCSGLPCFVSFSNQYLVALDGLNEDATVEQVREIDRLRMIRNSLRDSIVEIWLLEENYSGIEDLLIDSGVEEDLRILLSVQIESKQYEAAENLIENFSAEGDYTNDYFTIQNTYLTWLLTGNYSSNALNLIWAIINKNSRNSGYAAGVWSIVKDTPYVPEIRGGGSGLPCRSGGGGSDYRVGGETADVISFGSLLAVPNPTTGNFSLNFDSEISGTLAILNSLGQLVLNRKIKSEKNVNINTENWFDGIYYIHLKNDLGKVQTGKVLIQK